MNYFLLKIRSWLFVTEIKNFAINRNDSLGFSCLVPPGSTCLQAIKAKRRERRTERPNKVSQTESTTVNNMPNEPGLNIFELLIRYGNWN